MNLIPQEWVGQILRGLCVLALLAAPSTAVAAQYQGLVSFGGLPVPGATVTVMQGSKKFVTVTDMRGFYSFPTLADGAATVQIRMTGFFPIGQPVTIAPDVAMGKWELKLLSLGEIQPVLKPVLSAGITEAQATSEPKKTGDAPKQGDQPPPPQTKLRSARWMDC